MAWQKRNLFRKIWAEVNCRKGLEWSKGSRDRGLRQQLQDNKQIDNSCKRQRLRLNIDRTLEKPDRKAFRLQLVKRGPGTSSGLRKTKNSALWRRRPLLEWELCRNQPPPKRKKHLFGNLA
jgi:hypothetical protein